MARTLIKTVGQPLKNYFINSDFSIWQRNVGTAGPFTEDTSYTYKGPDRWQHRFDDAVASSTVRAWARINDAPVTVLNASPLGISAFRHIFRRGNTGIWVSLLQQRVESYLAAEMYNQNPTGKVSVSIWIKSLTATNITMQLSTANAKDNFAATTLVISDNKTFTNNGTWQQVKWEGIATTAAFVNGVNVQFDIRTPAAVGADGADQDLRVTMMQLNKGEKISDFSNCGATPAEELRLCQRYFAKTYAIESSVGAIENSFTITSYAFATAAQVANAYWAFPVRMRTTPATTIYNGSTGALNTWQDTGGAAITVAIQAATTGGAFLINTGSMASGRYCSGHITADAEL